MLEYIYLLLINLTIFSCLMVFFNYNPINAVLYLISVFLNLSLLLIFVGFDFLGLLFLTIYIGAIAIFFLFIIMVVNVPIFFSPQKFFTYLFTLICLIIVFFCFETLFKYDFLYQQSWTNRYFRGFLFYEYFRSVEIFASVLYTHYFLIFLLLAVVLLIGMLASMQIIQKIKEISL